MHTDQARRLVTVHDQADRALANLRNAAAMATDDPRSTELLEEGGDAYAEATAALFTEQSRVVGPHLKATPSDPAPPSGATADGFEDGKAVWIVGEDGKAAGAGFIAADVEGVADGSVAVRLTTDASYGGESFPSGATVAIPAASLTTEAHTLPGAGETPAEGSDKGKVPAGA